MVLVRADERDELASDVAGQLAEPGLWLLPAVAIALCLAIWRGLRPLQALSRDVAELEVDKAERLEARHPYREFNSVVRSINMLVGQQQASLERERQLASEVAHELRTPLSSITLQASSLRGELTSQAREQALAQIGADAMRAGHVITQLLALARASRSDLQQQMQRLDLGALAGEVVAGYAQAFWESGHQLSLQGRSDGRLEVLSHPLLLELACATLSTTPCNIRPRVLLCAFNGAMMPRARGFRYVTTARTPPPGRAPQNRPPKGWGWATKL
jgi:two-component system sensor histidine kinase QseC